MTTTSLSLIQRIKDADDEVTWRRFVELYSPMLFRWAEHTGLSKDDAADLVQEVFLVLMKELPRFELDPKSSFRAWLKTITRNRARDFLRRRARRQRVERSAFDGRDGQEEDEPFFSREEYNSYLARTALGLMQSEFDFNTWKACWECTVPGRPASEVGKELGMTTNAVYLAKSRVLRRLRKELDQLVD